MRRQMVRHRNPWRCQGAGHSRGWGHGEDEQDTRTVNAEAVGPRRCTRGGDLQASARGGRHGRIEGGCPLSPSSTETEHDYGVDGVDIQTAMVRHVRANPDRARRSKHILWNGEALWTCFEVPVLRAGRFRIAFLSEPRTPPQGVDVKAEGGRITMRNGEAYPVLRTWHDRCEDVVEYPFESGSGLLKVWNVYSRTWRDGRVTEEKWTGNAGMRVDHEADGGWRFRCSASSEEAPDFDHLVFRLTILGP